MCGVSNVVAHEQRFAHTKLRPRFPWSRLYPSLLAFPVLVLIVLANAVACGARFDDFVVNRDQSVCAAVS